MLSPVGSGFYSARSLDYLCYPQVWWKGSRVSNIRSQASWAAALVLAEDPVRRTPLGSEAHRFAAVPAGAAIGTRAARQCRVTIMIKKTIKVSQGQAR